LVQQASDPIVFAAVAATGASSAVVDLYTRRVPNALTLGVTSLGLTLATLHVGGATFGGALAGFALGFALMLPGHLAGATGAGDVKLFAALGTLLGPSGIGWAFLYTAIAGGVLALALSVQRGRLAETLSAAATLVTSRGRNAAAIEQAPADNRFAYAPAIAIGTLAVALGV
jgi:prepilin peptidase CpaA